MGRVSIAFVDDHPIVLDGLVEMFSSYDDFEVIARGACASDARALATAQKLDVIVIDLNMPGNVFEAIKEIAQYRPGTKIVVFTASLAIDHAVQALEAGASGYVVKGATAGELVDAIHVVLNGDTFITHTFATKVIMALKNASLRKIAAESIRLSVREEQVIRLLLRGKTNKEIGCQLKISEKTVKHYMTALMYKLNARNRIEVVLAAQKLEATRGRTQQDWIN